MVSSKVWLPLVAMAGLLMVSTAQAQKALRNNEISIDGLYQTTPTVSGNGITDQASHSGGGAATFSHSYHWWLGYQAGYEYSRYTDFYSGQIFGVQHNQHEFSGSWYVHGPRTLRIQPFAYGGISLLDFSPSLNGGQNVKWQARPGINFGGGIDYPLMTGHFGVRIAYHGVEYKAPDWGQAKYTTNAWRLTSEPMAGLFFRF